MAKYILQVNDQRVAIDTGEENDLELVKLTKDKEVMFER